jgi:transcriptional regulator with GAF, ATPase, and Fis domain
LFYSAFLQERKFERIGGSHPIQADVRVKAATNRTRMGVIASGVRRDLLNRLNVFPIETPPLSATGEREIPTPIEYPGPETSENCRM